MFIPLNSYWKLQFGIFQNFSNSHGKLLESFNKFFAPLLHYLRPKHLFYEDQNEPLSFQIIDMFLTQFIGGFTNPLKCSVLTILQIIF